MTPIDRDDPLRLLDLNRLSRLPTPAPDAARAARVVARCQRILARQTRGRLQRQRIWRRIPEPAVIAGFALMYVVEMVQSMWRWHRAS